MARNDAEGEFNRAAFKKASLCLFSVKAVIGLTLLICGFFAVHYTKGQDLWGPPYFIGAFVAGTLLFISSVFALASHIKSRSVDLEVATEKQRFGNLICLEAGFAVTALFSCFIGFFFVSWGLKSCSDPNAFHSTCHVVRNIEQNKRLAIIILVGLILTVFGAISTLYVICCSPILGRLRQSVTRNVGGGNRRGARFVFTHNTNIMGESTQPGFVHVYQTDTVGGDAEDSAHLRRLEEENRLLREQLELRQQLGGTHPQPCTAGVYPAPPPPSYGDCVVEPAKFDPGPSTSIHIPYDEPSKPSAPPM